MRPLLTWCSFVLWLGSAALAAHPDGTSTVPGDQSVGAGIWNDLGVVKIDNNGSLVVTLHHSPFNNRGVVADAIRVLQIVD